MVFVSILEFKLFSWDWNLSSSFLELKRITFANKKRGIISCFVFKLWVKFFLNFIWKGFKRLKQVNGGFKPQTILFKYFTIQSIEGKEPNKPELYKGYFCTLSLLVVAMWLVEVEPRLISRGSIFNAHLSLF